MKCKFTDIETECHVWVGELRESGDAWEFIERICPKCENHIDYSVPHCYGKYREGCGHWCGSWTEVSACKLSSPIILVSKQREENKDV